ncbi:MAG: Fe-S-binding domain-containing protein, partial [Nitrospinota bacterium]
GVIWAAVYMLWMFQRVMFGEITKEENKKLPDLSAREFAYLIPLVVAVFWIGLYPNPIIKKTEASVKNLVQIVEKARKVEKAEKVRSVETASDIVARLDKGEAR